MSDFIDIGIGAYWPLLVFGALYVAYIIWRNKKKRQPSSGVNSLEDPMGISDDDCGGGDDGGGSDE